MLPIMRSSPRIGIRTYTSHSLQTPLSRRFISYTYKLSAMKLLYPTSLKLDVQSLEGFSVDLFPYDVKKTIPEEHVDAEILVTWTNTPENLKDAAKRLTKLQWIQSLAAGPNDVLGAGFDASKIKITTGSGLHDHTVAEHALGLLLNAARRFYEMRDYQLQGKWPGHLGGPQPDRPKNAFTTLRDARVLIWGFGNIAKTLTPQLIGLGADVRGIARRKGIRNGIEVYSEDDLDTLLPETDALVMILPGSDSTRHVLNAQRLKQLPNHAWVVNVGRGTSVDEDALVDALEKGEIGGAALDVFETEPLPEPSRIWKAPNTIVSPHAAGGRPQGAEGLIADNLRRFRAKQDQS
ncbi:D-isomer specific 2-hydroxyacid dehydrogenase, NAD-binding domain [Fusarium oxysporum f. sp. vasinfectum]|nr:D-isomer specific 2-hydroxyacid dehydrogenase, NAD-binding domain [Fusarium oxysporum f. sp. vasinfectum]